MPGKKKPNDEKPVQPKPLSQKKGTHQNPSLGLGTSASTSPIGNLVPFDAFGGLKPFAGLNPFVPESKQELDPLQKAIRETVTTLCRMPPDIWIKQLKAMPRYSSLLPQVVALASPLPLYSLQEAFQRKFKDTNQVIQAFYAVRAKGYEDSPSPSGRDAFLYDALVNRILHATNLELLYEHHVCLYINFLCNQYVASLENSATLEDRLAAIAAFINSDAELDSAVNLDILNHITYFEGSNFSFLLTHPASLWEIEQFAAFKRKLDIPKIRAEILSMPFITDMAGLEAFLEEFQRLHKEMISIYDLLAENDRALLAYCKEKNYSDEVLFSLNKTCILETLAGASDHLKNLETPQEGRALAYLESNTRYVSKQAQWAGTVGTTLTPAEKYEKGVAEIRYLFHPDVIFEMFLVCMEHLDTEFAHNLVKEVITSENGTVLLQFLAPIITPHLPPLMIPLIPQLMQSSLPRVLQYLQNALDHLSQAQKGGRPGLLKLLEQVLASETFKQIKSSLLLSLESNGLLQCFSDDTPGSQSQRLALRGSGDSAALAPEAKTLAKPKGVKTKASTTGSTPTPTPTPTPKTEASPLLPPGRPSFRTLIASLQSQLKKIKQGEKPKVEPITDAFIPELVTSGYHKRHARHALHSDPSLFLSQAMTAKAYPFVHEYVTNFDRQKEAEQYFDLVPSCLKEQRQFLTAAIAFYHANANQAKAVLKIMLSQKYTWNLEIIKAVEAIEPASFAKDLLKTYIRDAEKADEQEEDFRQETKTEGPEESGALNHEAALCFHLTAPSATATKLYLGRGGQRGGSAFFSKLDNERIDANELALRLMSYAQELPPPMKEAQSNAISLLLLRFFEAYRQERRPTIIGLSLEAAQRIRNALIHPQMIGEQGQSVTGFVLDGRGDLPSFACMVAEAIFSRNAKQLSTHPLFKVLENQGKALAENRSAGQNESVKCQQRVLYTRTFDGLFHAFQTMKKEEQSHGADPEKIEIFTSASIWMQIRGMVYCKEEAAFLASQIDKAIAMQLRHSFARLDMPAVKNIEAARLD